jgi:hypothetical protein
MFPLLQVLGDIWPYDQVLKGWMERREKQNLIVIIYAGGQCGTRDLEKAIQAVDIPVFRMHNIKDFISKYGSNIPKQNRKFLTFHLLLEMVAQVSDHVLVLDSYRDLLSRKISSFFSRLSFNIENILKLEEQDKNFIQGMDYVDYWRSLSPSEQVQLFETKIASSLERKEGLDSEVPGIMETVAFDRTTHSAFVAYPYLRDVFLCKLRYMDKEKCWEKVVSFYLQKHIRLSLDEKEENNRNIMGGYRNDYDKFMDAYRNTPVTEKRNLYAMEHDICFCRYLSQEERQQHLLSFHTDV